MSLTPSNMLELGTTAPDFDLIDVISGSRKQLQDVRGDKGTLIMFICNHCPYVIHVQDEIARLAEDYRAKGIGFVAISSNDIENYPADGPEQMRSQAKKVGFQFPYLFDETQDAAKQYDAACTPDFYLFDPSDVLMYRGRLDESRPNNGIPVTGKDVRDALNRLLEGVSQQEIQYPSMGCNIKWKL